VLDIIMTKTSIQIVRVLVDLYETFKNDFEWKKRVTVDQQLEKFKETNRLFEMKMTIGIRNKK